MYSTAVENYRNPFTTNYNGVNVGIRFEQYTSASPYGGFSVIIGNDAGTYTGFSYSPSAILTVEEPSAKSQRSTSSSGKMGTLITASPPPS